MNLSPYDSLEPSEFPTVVLSNLSISVNDISKGTDSLAWLADCAKNSQAREQVSSTGVIPKVFHLLDLSLERKDEEFTRNALRAIANLCFDNDVNRDEILEIYGSIKTVISVLDIPGLVLTTFGALLNLSMDNELVQNQMVVDGLVNKILEQVEMIGSDQCERDTVCMAVKVASSIFESDKGIQELVKLNGLNVFNNAIKVFTKSLSIPNPDNLEWIIETMDAIGVVFETLSNNDLGQQEIAKSSLPVIMEFVEQKSSIPESEEEPNLESIKMTLSKVVAAVTMSDKNMKVLVDNSKIINRIKTWTTITGHSVKLDDEIRMTGALCLGNLARSDETCLSLLKQDIVPPLLNLIKIEADRLRESQQDLKLLIKVIHGALGTIKNLSLAPGTKSELGRMNVIKILIGLFDIELMTPLHVTLISTIKNLVMGDNDANVYRTLTGLEPGNSNLKDLPVPATSTKSPIGRIVRVIWNTSREIDSGVKSEGGRLIANLVKAIHRSNATAFLPILVELHCITLLVQVLTGAHLTKPDNLDADAPHSDHHVQFNALGESSRVFPVVQNESVVALTLLCSMHPSAIDSLAKFEAIPVTLLKILSSPLISNTQKEEDGAASHSIHAKMNVLLLIKSLITKGAFVNESKAKLVSTLNDLINGDDKSKPASSVEFQFQAAIADILQLLNQ